VAVGSAGVAGYSVGACLALAGFAVVGTLAFCGIAYLIYKKVTKAKVTNAPSV